MMSGVAEDSEDDELASAEADLAPLPDPEPVAPELELPEDVTQLYLNEIAAKPLLTPDDEVATARLVRAGDFSARQKMIELKHRSPTHAGLLSCKSGVQSDREIISFMISLVPA